MATPATKSQVLLWIGAAIAIVASAGWQVLGAHSAVPHASAVSKDQFTTYIESQREWRASQQASIQEIKSYLQIMQQKHDSSARETHSLLLRIVNKE